ncbi:hypothetical protein D910_03098 [Dendroctonus ponderosae]
MVKLEVNLMRFLTTDDFIVLAAVEKGMENHAPHALVPIGEVASIARLRHWRTVRIIGNLQKHKLMSYGRGTRPEGLSLNASGYDYLKLNSLRKRDSVEAFGN